ncbi:MAG: hypothetical protein ACHQ1D_02345 [Nitrososphaerales archaeon]
MNHRLVSTCVKILCSLSPTGMNVNTIIKQTSSDRTYVTKAIKTLEKAGLVTKKRTNKHLQMRLVTPTVLAKNLRAIIDQIDHYNKSYLIFINATRDKLEKYWDDYISLTNIEVPPDAKRILKSKLLSDGWKEDETQYFVQWFEAKFEIERIIKRHIFHAVIYRYLTMSLKFAVNSLAKDIITHLLLSELQNQISLIVGDFENLLSADRIGPEKRDSIIRSIFYEFHDEVLSDFLGLYSGYHELAQCKFLNNEFSNLVYSILDLYNVGKKDLEEEIVVTSSNDINDWFQIHDSIRIPRKSSSENMKDRDLYLSILKSLISSKST